MIEMSAMKEFNDPWRLNLNLSQNLLSGFETQFLGRNLIPDFDEKDHIFSAEAVTTLDIFVLGEKQCFSKEVVHNGTRVMF